MLLSSRLSTSDGTVLELSRESSHVRPPVSPTADVAVAVGKGEGSAQALKWALETLTIQGGGATLHLMHVQPPLRLIHTPLGYLPIDQANEESQKHAKEQQFIAAEKVLQKYRKMCEQKKVDVKVHCLENPSIHRAVVEQVSKLGISKLVVGSSSKSKLRRMLKGSKTQAIVAENVPGFCAVMVVHNGRLLSLKDADHSVLSVGSPCCSNIYDNGSMHYTKGTFSLTTSCTTNIENSFHVLNSSPRTDNSLPYWTACCTESSLNLDSGHGELLLEDVKSSHLISNHTHTTASIRCAQSKSDDSTRLSGSGQQDSVSAAQSTSNSASDTLTVHEANQVNGSGGHDNNKRMSKGELSDFKNAEASELTLSKEVRDDLCVAFRSALKVNAEKFMQTVNEERKKCKDLLSTLSIAKDELEFLKKEVDMAKQQAAVDRSNCTEALSKVEELKRKLAKEIELRKFAERRAWKAKQSLTKILRKAHRDFISFSFDELKLATNHFGKDSKLGEGGYGGVYKGKLNDVSVAVKVLRQGVDAQQHATVDGREQFQHEVEVLSYIRHPHIVELLGVCQEKACIVYEYMENGSLEDRLRCKNGTPPLPWFVRFSICFEVAIALLFLHNLTPNSIIHRDLKPGNILLDSCFVSKLSDAGLARWIPNDMTFDHTVYRETRPAGTFAYIDPEYLRTGTFGPHSDIFALGIVIVQVLTGRPPVGVVDLMEAAVKEQRIHEVLDPLAGEWPLQEAEDLAKLGLLCAEPKRRERPNLETHVFPILKRLYEMAQNAVTSDIYRHGLQNGLIPSCFICPLSQGVMQNPHIAADGFTYEYLAIKNWLAQHDVSPMTNLKLAHKKLCKNYSLDSKIKGWLRELNWQQTRPNSTRRDLLQY